MWPSRAASPAAASWCCRRSSGSTRISATSPTAMRRRAISPLRRPCSTGSGRMWNSATTQNGMSEGMALQKQTVPEATRGGCRKPPWITSARPARSASSAIAGAARWPLRPHADFPGVCGAVGYYGGGIGSHAGSEAEGAAHAAFRRAGRPHPHGDVEKIRAALPDVPVYTYPAGHGFNCDHARQLRQAERRSGSEPNSSFPRASMWAEQQFFVRGTIRQGS